MSRDALVNRSCVPCRGDTPPLADAEIAGLLRELDAGWRVKDGVKLEKSYRFADFAGPLAFVNAIGAIAETEGHHPDLRLGWGRVRVELQTHVIKALTESDFIMAAKIDRARAGLPVGG